MLPFRHISPHEMPFAIYQMNIYLNSWKCTNAHACKLWNRTLEENDKLSLCTI